MATIHTISIRFSVLAMSLLLVSCRGEPPDVPTISVTYDETERLFEGLSSYLEDSTFEMVDTEALEAEGLSLRARYYSKGQASVRITEIQPDHVNLIASGLLPEQLLDLTEQLCGLMLASELPSGAAIEAADIQGWPLGPTCANIVPAVQ